MTDLDKLCEAICSAKLTLKVAYDVPQIYTAYNVKTGADYIKLLEDTKQYRQYIGGVHLWGKRLSDSGRKVSHCGDLNSYFGNEAIKQRFLEAFSDCVNDGVVRKMVLEVNSGNEDLQSIVTDLMNIGIQFV